MPNEAYAFGEFTLDVTERRLTKGGVAVGLEPKTFDVLAALVRQAGRLVSKRRLLDDVWPDAFVDEGILSVHVARLRTALGREGAGRQIETVSRSGYRFTAAVASYSGAAHRVRAPAIVQRDPRIHSLIGHGRSRVLSASFFDVPQAVAAFQEAIAVNPAYAAAHAGLALACCAQAELRLTPHGDAYANARSAALRALALDDRCADAHAAMSAVLLMNDWDWLAAERSLERTLALDPDHTEAYVLYGRLMDALGRLDLGLGFKTRALERDPDSPFVQLEIALSYWNRREYDRVLEWAGRAAAADPRHLLAREVIAGVHWKRGDFERHLEESIAHAREFGVPDEAFADLRHAYATGGRRAVIAYSIERASAHDGRLPHVQVAILNSELGETDRAFEHLDAALDARDPALVQLAVAPQWDHLRADSRIGLRLERMGLGG